MHLDIKTYSCIRFFRSSSSRSCFSCKSTSVFSEATEGEGLVGLGKEFALEESILWLTVSVDNALDGESDLEITVVLLGTSKLPEPVSEEWVWW